MNETVPTTSMFPFTLSNTIDGATVCILNNITEQKQPIQTNVCDSGGLCPA